MKRSLILASTSPRRQALLGEVSEAFTIVAPRLEQEILDPTLPLAKALEQLALEKARSVAKSAPDAVVIGADTLVCKDGRRMGKPHDGAEAAAMLRLLSGATHEVITAVAICCEEAGVARTAHAVSRVTFRDLSEAEIAAYIAGGEPMDKAGSYGIQGEGGKFVARLEGDFDNVVGLPTALVRKLLADLECL
ncbi:MAG: Maf family protein [Peptococcaceae bacterium]|nr:Maf family protein [Peptococcaceae bacterium]